MKKVAVIGFGYIGSVIGTVLADRGFEVIGVEQNRRIITAISGGKSPFNEPGLEQLIKKNVKEGRLHVSDDPSTTKECTVFIITVGTPLSEDFKADVSQIQNAVGSIAPYVKDGDLVVVKSTVPPFTTDQYVAAPLRERVDVRVAFCPERLAEGKAISEFTSIPVVAGGIDKASTQAAVEFWREALGVDVIPTSSAAAAELVKLADNLWIDVNIALAGELAKISDKMNVDVLEVIKAANSLPKGATGGNVNILTPSVGVGGYCLTKDPWFVQHIGKQYGLDLLLPKAGRNVNDSMPVYSAQMIDELLMEQGRLRGDFKVAVLGIAFKNNTGDCRYTPTKPAIDELIRLGYQVEICDPWTSEHDNAMVTDRNVGKDPEAAMCGADCIAFLAGHQDFHAIPIARMAELANPGALVFDGRMFFSKEKIEQMDAHGLRYKGVGR